MSSSYGAILRSRFC